MVPTTQLPNQPSSWSPGNVGAGSSFTLPASVTRQWTAVPPIPATPVISEPTMEMAMPSTGFIVLVISVTGLLLLTLAVAIVIIQRRKNNTHHQSPAFTRPIHLSTAKQWLGEAPTDPNTRESFHDRVHVLVDTDEYETTQLALMTEAANLCRSLPYERSIVRALTDIGHRTVKYNCAVLDAKMNQATRRNDWFVQTTINTDTLNVLDYRSKKRQLQIKSLLTSLRHSNILPIHDVSVSSLTSHFFLLQPWCTSGSLRDIMHGTDPTQTYSQKYFNSDDSIKHGTPFPKRLYVQYCWQIILALMYLQRKGIRHYNIQSGNIFLYNDRVVVGGYEGSIFGFRNRLHRKLRRITTKNPILLSLAFLLYEMATGDEVVITVDDKFDLRIRNSDWNDVNDFIVFILNCNHDMMFEELLAHKLFRTTTGLAPVYNIEEDDQPPIERKIAKRIIQPVHNYFDTTVYKRGVSKSNDSVIVDIKPEKTRPSNSRRKSRTPTPKRSGHSSPLESDSDATITTTVSHSSSSSRSSRGSANNSFNNFDRPSGKSRDHSRSNSNTNITNDIINAKILSMNERSRQKR